MYTIVSATNVNTKVNRDGDHERLALVSNSPLSLARRC